MTLIVGTDIQTGIEMNWYVGGIVTEESRSVLSGEESAGYITLTGIAEYASVWLLVDGVPTTAQQYQANGSTHATEASGTKTIKYTGLEEGDELEIYYIDVSSIPLTHCAVSRGLDSEVLISQDERPVVGRESVLIRSGARSRKVRFGELWYNLTFLATFYGSKVTDSTEGVRWSDRTRGVNTVGAIVGKRIVNGSVTSKMIIGGCKARSIVNALPTEDWHTRNFEFSAEYLLIATGL